MASIQKRPGRGGRLRYRVQIRLRGGVRSATFPTWQAARQWATITEGTLRTQRVEPTREALYHTLGELLERYRRQVGGPAVTEQKTTLLLSTALVVSLWHKSA